MTTRHAVAAQAVGAPKPPDVVSPNAKPKPRSSFTVPASSTVSAVPSTVCSTARRVELNDGNVCGSRIDRLCSAVAFKLGARWAKRLKPPRRSSAASVSRLVDDDFQENRSNSEFSSISHRVLRQKRGASRIQIGTAAGFTVVEHAIELLQAGQRTPHDNPTQSELREPRHLSSLTFTLPQRG